MREEETRSAVVTRREALKKIGRFGIYVPATMAVLTAAPRAFAGSGGPATLQGRIWECVTYVPIEGATVTVYCDPQRSGKTNSNGEFRITGIPEGTWDCGATADGYKPSNGPLSFLPGEVVTADGCLYPDDTGGDLDSESLPHQWRRSP
jgi:hypothetical protein